MVEKTHTTGLWPALADPFRALGARLGEWIAPLADASGSDGAYKITVELPGVAEADISLSAHDGMLMLKGEKRVEREEKGETWYFSERQYGGFSRSFRLPPDADDTRVSADLKDGILTITVPKRAAVEPKAKNVKINAA